MTVTLSGDKTAVHSFWDYISLRGPSKTRVAVVTHITDCDSRVSRQYL